jgi:hypothetical protein
MYPIRLALRRIRRIGIRTVRARTPCGNSIGFRGEKLRSPEGFLTRLHRGDEVIGTLHEAWERPVREVIRELGLSEGLFEFALMFCNSHFDPRELDDLFKNRGNLSEAAALRILINSFYGALKGMAES